MFRTYLGETSRRLNERIIEHAAKDNKPNAQTFTSISPFIISPNNFIIFSKGYTNKGKINVSEAVLFSKHQPLLNIHENSVP